MEIKAVLLWTVLLASIGWSHWEYYGQCGSETEMRDLLNATLNNTEYSSRVRPIADTGNSLQVIIDLYLVAVNEIDEVGQKMTSTAYLNIEWPDSFITWNPADYGNISKITIPQYRLWKPDVALSNAYDTITGLGSNFMYVEVDYNGTVTWRPYQVFDSSCTVDMTYFPFDEQKCELLLVTWSSTKEMISLVTGSVGFNIDNYAINANWDLLSVSTYDSSTSSTSGLAFSLKLKRKPIFFLINFIVPILLLSFLNIFVFILPCDSGEKASYAIVLFLSFAIFLLIVTEMMPEGMTTVPVISTYLMLECIISTLIVFMTIIQLRLHNMGEETGIPKSLKTFVEVVDKIKGMLNCICCDCKKKATNNEDGGKDQIDEKNRPAVVTVDKPDKAKEAVGEKRLSLKTDSKFRDLIYGKKVSPALFVKPEVKNTPYDKDIELQDLDDNVLSLNIPKRQPIRHAVDNTPPTTNFANKRRQSLVSETDLPGNTAGGDKDGADVEWSDVTGAMDWFFAWLFTIVTILITLVVIFVLVV